jgi:SprT protein
MAFTPDEQARLALLQAKVEERIQQLLVVARRELGFAAPRPEIRFDLRGQSAGQARLSPKGRGLIRFNPWLLLQHGEDFIEQTVAHEIAHCLTFCLYGRNARPHGAEWRQLMKLLGAAPERCHHYDLGEVPQRQVSRHPYHCGCQEHELSAIRHNRVRKGQRYLCRRCGGPLQPGRMPK